MKLPIKNQIYQAINEHKWLDITYINSKNETTNFFVGIYDINFEKGTLYCEIFNYFKSLDVIDRKVNIHIDKIKSASVIEQSFYLIPKKLQDKLENSKDLVKFFELVNYDNNILMYFTECFKYDTDPYLKNKIEIDGIDLHTLTEKNEYKLDDKQFHLILENLFINNWYGEEKVNQNVKLAFNKLSIDINGKQYVVAYKLLTLNFKDRTLKLNPKTLINKSFLITEKKKVTLNSYLDMDPVVFSTSFDEREKEYIEMFKQKMTNGELINTKPSIFVIENFSNKGIINTFDSIFDMDNSENNRLTFPLKSFFGRNRSKGTQREDIDIVIYDKNKTNIDQLRVIYNSMINHVTFVKGPPGTGKTETIFNVVLSAYANNKTVLVCSYNNHPVDDLYNKIQNSLKDNNSSNFNEDIKFPMLRLGNMLELKSSIIYIKSLLEYIEKHNINLKDNLTEITKKSSLSNFQKVKKTLKSYEEYYNLISEINNYKKIQEICDIDSINKEIKNKINLTENEIIKYEKINYEDILNNVVSASENAKFQKFLYYSSLSRFKKLLQPTYKELREIVLLENIETAVDEFNKWLKDDVNLKRLLAVFPIILCTNLSCSKLGSPNPHFDLAIMDEAGQCNIASSLVSIVRCNDLVLVGDTNQLQPITVLEENINIHLMKKYNISDDYNYTTNSILSTMIKKDPNSLNILLSYHYRCPTKIINFSNQRYYNKKLKFDFNKEGELKYINVKNSDRAEDRNSYHEEALAIVKVIKENNYKDVAIITPFNSQADLINQYLAKYNIKDVKADTVHSVQRSEKSTIILSTALSLKTAKRTMEWVENNKELINVAITRAKRNFIFVADKEAIDLLNKDKDTDIKELSNYIYANGKYEVQSSIKVINSDFSNNSKNERMFFFTIKPYFNRRNSKFKIERNVPVKKAIKDASEYDLQIIGKKEFDLIVQVKDDYIINRYRTIIAFEIDGGEHVGSKITVKYDREKEEISRKYGIKIIRISNNDIKDYETIITLFENVANISNSNNQISLFDN
ncbi:MAG: AAA domain-containing protein [Bacillales bacterium]